MEVVNSRTRFGGWVRHVFLAIKTCDRSDVFSHRCPASSLSHGFALSKNREEFLRERAFQELDEGD